MTHRWFVSLAALAALACAEANESSDASPPRQEQLLPAGVRRLTRSEYDRAVIALTGESSDASSTWPPDTRQSGFSRNAAQIVDPLLGSLLSDSTASLAAHAVAKWQPCSASGDRECARQFISSFGARAFSRPLSDTEIERYLGVFDAGSADGNFASGAALVVATWLSAPSFLYVSELGETDATSGLRQLTPFEVAAGLSWAVAGMPPDATSISLARTASLSTPEQREREARRLLLQSDARFHYRRFVSEWLGIDGLAARVKDARLFPQFGALRASLVDDAERFIDRAFIERGGTLSAFLTGGLSEPPEPLRTFYGSPDPATRIGALQHPSFLAQYAHEDSSAPVLRGAVVLRRLLCRELPSPTELGIEIVPVAPDPNATTRERYAQHASDPACAGCHRAIDGIGVSFENFDAVGRLRSEEVGKPIDSSGHVTLHGEQIALADSVALARALATDPEAEACLARQVFRFASGQREAAPEQAFVNEVAGLGKSERSSVLELFVHFVRRPHFVWRRQP